MGKNIICKCRERKEEIDFNGQLCIFLIFLFAYTPILISGIFIVLCLV